MLTWLILMFPLCIPGLLYCRRLGTQAGSIISLLPWVGGALGYLGGVAGTWPYNAVDVAERLNVASLWINFGCVFGILINARLRIHLFSCRYDSRRLFIWIFLLFYIFSVLWAPYGGLLYPAVSIMGLLSFALVGSVISVVDINIAIKSVILFGLLTLVLSLFYDGIFIPGIPIFETLKYNNAFSYQSLLNYRRLSVLPYAATDAAVISLGFIAAYLISNQRKKWNLFAIFCVLVLFLHLCIIQARWILANGIAVFLCVGLLNFLDPRRVKLTKRIIGLTALILVTATTLAFLDGFDFMSRGAINKDLTRSKLYRIGWQTVIDGPLLGNGFGSSANSLKKSADYTDSASGITFGAHNTYILIGLEMGIVGLIVWIFIVIWSLLSWSRFIIRDYQKKPDSFFYLDLLVIGFVGLSIIIGGLFHSLINVPWLWYMLLYNLRKKKLISQSRPAGNYVRTLSPKYNHNAFVRSK